MAAIPSHSIRTPRWMLNYGGVNITSDIAAMVIAVTYTDRLSTGSGEIEIEIEDRARLWQSSWYPSKGDVLNLMLGYAGEPLMPCGDFQIDELALEGPPDSLHLCCVAAYITETLRTRQSAGYESVSLLEIAATIAARHGLRPIDSTDGIAAIAFARVTQNHETDLGFLRRIATCHGYDFTVRGAQMVFYSRAALEAQAPAGTIARGSVTQFCFRDKSHRIYRAATVAYQDPASKLLVTQSAATAAPPASADTLALNERVENASQARLRADAALHERNRMLTTCRLVLPGEPIYLAGNVVALAGWGALDGTYLIETARHRIDTARGYTASIEARRIS